MKLMKTSQKGIDLIKKYEVLKLKAYKPLPSEKYYTIGWGHYGADVKANAAITYGQAEQYLKEDVASCEMVLNAMGVNFCQNQFDALISWLFNIGIGHFNSSTLKKKILANAPDMEITDQMVRWVNACGKPLLGLKKRRVEEANMWLGYTKYNVDAVGNINKIQ